MAVTEDIRTFSHDDLKDSRKILIAFQFWDGDKKQMMKVARFLSNVEPGISERADVLFMARNDCTQDEETIQRVANKFHVFHAISRRSEVGWPAGCNGIFFGTMDWVFEMREAKKIPDHKAILIMESDACPLVPDWIAKLSDAWDAAGVRVLGPLQPEPYVHINGNAMYSTDRDFLFRVSRQIGGCTPHGGYDYVLHGEWVRQGCADCKLMKSWWRHPSLTTDVYTRLVDAGVVFLHGIKDDSVMERYLERYPR